MEGTFSRGGCFGASEFACPRSAVDPKCSAAMGPTHPSSLPTQPTLLSCRPRRKSKTTVRALKAMEEEQEEQEQEQEEQEERVR